MQYFCPAIRGQVVTGAPNVYNKDDFDTGLRWYLYGVS